MPKSINENNSNSDKSKLNRRDMLIASTAVAERTGWPDSGTKFGAQQYFDWFKYEFWRFAFVQHQIFRPACSQ
ncbi:hypothetical protein Q2941_18380 [Bradyrhizobium sp. UFLA05-153]